jgi:quercetin dioxygenase-like cupin family protein
MSAYFVRPEECGYRVLFEGVEIRTMAGKDMMMSVVNFEPDAEVPTHSHPHEQIGLLLEGELLFTVGDERRELIAGDMWRIPGGVMHHVVAGPGGARALDIFHPVRQDYL